MALQIEELASQLASSHASKSQWRSYSYRLEAQLEEQLDQEKGIAKQIVSLENECSQGRQDMCMLQTKTNAAADEMSRLLSKVYINNVMLSGKCLRLVE